MLIADVTQRPVARPPGRRPAAIWLPLLVLAVGGCASLMGGAINGMAEDLGAAVLDNPDVAMVRDGAPAYLILLDGLVARRPNDVNLLAQASRLNSAYAAAFVEDVERSRYLQEKALGLAERAVCEGLRNGCDVRRRPFDAFQAWLAERSAADVPLL